MEEFSYLGNLENEGGYVSVLLLTQRDLSNAGSISSVS